MDWLTRAYAASPLALWLLGSVLAYVLVTNLLWWLAPRAYLRSAPGRMLREMARFLYFVGVPYLALGGWPRRPLQGLLAPEDLGLVPLHLPGSTALPPAWPLTRWLGAVGTGLSLGLGGLLVLALAWRCADLRLPARPLGALLLDGFYAVAHWAFYQAAQAALLDSVYAGAFLGLGLVYVEWALDPTWREGWRSAPGAARRWLRAALLLVVVLIFYLTQNLWVCLGVYALLALPFWSASRARTSPPRPRPPV